MPGEISKTNGRRKSGVKFYHFIARTDRERRKLATSEKERALISRSEPFLGGSDCRDAVTLRLAIEDDLAVFPPRGLLLPSLLALLNF